MNTRILGRTELPVSEIGLGGLFVSEVGGPRDQGVVAVCAALKAGINYFDTAPTYADSEEVLGEALEGVTREVILSTKLGGRPQPFDPRDAKTLRRSLEESLRLLGRDRVDILFVHEPDRPGQWDWWSDPDRYYGPVCEVLETFKAEGLIRFTGLGGTTAYQLPRIIETGQWDVVLTAFNYSILWREAEVEVLPAAHRHNAGIVIGSPLQQGALARRYDDEVKARPSWMAPQRQRQFLALYDLVDNSGIALPEMGIRFVLSNPDISTTLVGARSAEEVRCAVEYAERGPLPSDVLARLDEIAAIAPCRPYEEPSSIPFGRGWSGPWQLR